MKSAKKAKEKVNYASVALDFHILYDTTATSLAAIRKKMKSTLKKGDASEKMVCMTAKPFVVDAVGDQSSNTWCKEHNWSDFQAAVAALQKKNKDGKLCLPSSQSHRVRANLFAQNIETQEHEWELLCKRYAGFQWLPKSLYKNKKEEGEGEGTEIEICYTLFLDALESMNFYPNGKDQIKNDGEK